MVNSDGKIDPTWYRFLFDLHERTGGGAIDKVDLSAGASETAINAAADAQDAADEARLIADEIEDRFDFEFDFDLR